MVLGISRDRTTLARRAPAIERAGPVFGWDDWLIERGAVHWEASADLTGGFPGYVAHGCRLEGCQVRVTERFLLINEGRVDGFGLPLAWIVDADVVPSPLRGDRGEVALRVRYNDRDRVRTFLARFRGPFLTLRGPRRAEQALIALRTVGVEEGVEPLPPLPDLGHSWVEAARFEQENVIWSGVASAAAGPGREIEPSDVWLTTRSVIWGGGSGDGVQRLSLDRILDVLAGELEGRTRVPVLYLSCADEAGGRHDLPLVFDRQHPPSRSHRERGALLVGLRSRGIPLGSSPVLPQPWQSALAQVAADSPAPESTTGPLDLPLADPATVSRFRAPSASARIARFRGESVPADATAPEPPKLELLPTSFHDTGAFGRGALTLLPWHFDDQPEAVLPMDGTTLDDAGAETETPVLDDAVQLDADPAVAVLIETDHDAIGAVEGDAVEPESGAAEIFSAMTDGQPGPAHVLPSQLAVVESIEHALVAVLIEAARGIDRCLGGESWTKPTAAIPSTADQMVAHAALDELLAQGTLGPEEVRSRRSRLVAVGEAGPRLRSLLELHQSALLTDAQLATRRGEIIAPLASLLTCPTA